MMGFIRMTFVDVIDIVVVAMLLFYVYKVLRGTHATSILYGILLIYIIWVVVRALNMELLTSILGGLVNIGIVALIVIFQPEIRRFLQTIGTRSRSRQRVFLNRIFDVKGADTGTKYIAPVVQACEDMASSYTGALIVVKQESSLQEVVDSGVMVDAIITSSLLKNIFFKNSPLHDGAVVIDNNRIVAAKCVLPSTRTEVPISFGMRHRAALGISEVSDALIIVVSEERGSISLAHNGKILSGLSATELQAELLKQAQSAESNGRRTRSNSGKGNTDAEASAKSSI